MLDEADLEFDRELIDKVIGKMKIPDELRARALHADMLIDEMVALLVTEEPSLRESFLSPDLKDLQIGILLAINHIMATENDLGRATHMIGVLLDRGLRTAAMVAVLNERRAIDV